MKFHEKLFAYIVYCSNCNSDHNHASSAHRRLLKLWPPIIIPLPFLYFFHHILAVQSKRCRWYYTSLPYTSLNAYFSWDSVCHLMAAYWFRHKNLNNFRSSSGAPISSKMFISFSWLIWSKGFWENVKYAYTFLLNCMSLSLMVWNWNIASLVPLPFQKLKRR